MTIADVLNAELEAAAADLERGCDRAADAATTYIMRRLQQLERRFPRHRFTYGHRAGCRGLEVYPAVNRSNSVEGLLRSLCSRTTRWRTMHGLHHVSRDLDAIAFRIEESFCRYLGLIESHGATVPRLAFKDRSQGDGRKAYDNRMADRMSADAKRLNRPIPQGRSYALRA